MSASPRIKVCGLTRTEDARLAVELGAWALGFIFHAASPRATTPAAVGSLLKEIGPSGIKTVGVFVNASLEEIRQAVAVAGVDTIQLHGEETPQFCVQLKAILPRISIFRALRPKSHEELAALPAYGATCEAILLDTYVEGTRGGTGMKGDWSLATLASESSRDAKIILAGGLNPANIREALRTPGLFAVDVSSGLEESPGRKSADKMKKFFENARTTRGVLKPETQS